jgi:hypothetical protein
VTQIDSAGRESDSIAASQVVILQPPAVSSIAAAGNTAVIIGKGTPGARISVFDKTNKTVGTATVAADGSFEVKVPNLPEGTHPFTASQADSAGVSNTMNAGSVVIGPATVAAPSVTNAETVGAKGRVSGTGIAGATIKLLDANDQEIGTATVAADGTYIVTSINDLPSGTNPLKVRQVSGVLQSATISAGNAVVPPTVTSSELQSDKGLISGKGKPGAAITLYDGSVIVGSGTVDS